MNSGRIGSKAPAPTLPEGLALRIVPEHIDVALADSNLRQRRKTGLRERGRDALSAKFRRDDKVLKIADSSVMARHQAARFGVTPVSGSGLTFCTCNANVKCKA